ncbi:MAG: Ig-like domain-containing protein [Myxococcota bacterium]
MSHAADGGLDLGLDAGAVPADLGGDAGLDLGADAGGDFAVDVTPPVVVGSNPVEGATRLDPEGVDALCLSFSEPMDFSRARVRLEGGRGALGDLVVASAVEVCAPVLVEVERLSAARTYRLRLEGFRDLAGVPLDGVPYLGDGVLDFATGPVVRFPYVVDSTPREGAVGVGLPLTEIRLVFSRDMDTSRAPSDFFFSDGVVTTVLRDTRWVDDRTLVVDLADVDVTDPGPYLLDLRGSTLAPFLSPSAYLGDPAPGVLDFEVGRDVFPPTVVACAPGEGSTVPPATGTLRCQFDEPMLTGGETATLDDGSIVSGLSEVRLVSDDGVTRTLAGVWSGADAVFEVNVLGLLASRRVYRVDFSAFRDKRGRLLDGVPTLGDGALDFSAR